MAPRVLLIDESEASRDWVGSLLAAAGAEVIEARDGLAGMQRAIEDSPALVLVAAHLTGFSGIEIRARLAANESTTKLTVLVLQDDFEMSDLRGLLAAA